MGAKESLGRNDDLANRYGGVCDKSQGLRAHNWA